MEQEGPRLYESKSFTLTICNGCKYHIRRLVRSGFDPIYENCCLYHQNMEYVSIYKPSRLDGDDKFVIPNEFCPFLDSFNRDLKINKILE